MITPAAYTSLWPALSAAILADLPAETATRLKAGHHPVRHGSHGSYLGQIWDRRQNDLLPKDHFVYCLALDVHRRNHPANSGYFHAWFNLTRIYRDREAIANRLMADLRHVPLPGFDVDIHARAISLGFRFDWPAAPDATTALLVPRIADLIQRVHPVVAPVIDSLSVHTESDDQDRPAREGALSLVRSLDARTASRAVLPAWRAEILAAQHHRCAACGGDLRALGHHIDHIVPFSRGGTSERHNLQALCPPRATSPKATASGPGTDDTDIVPPALFRRLSLPQSSPSAFQPFFPSRPNTFPFLASSGRRAPPTLAVLTRPAREAPGSFPHPAGSSPISPQILPCALPFSTRPIPTPPMASPVAASTIPFGITPPTSCPPPATARTPPAPPMTPHPATIHHPFSSMTSATPIANKPSSTKSSPPTTKTPPAPTRKAGSTPTTTSSSSCSVGRPPANSRPSSALRHWSFHVSRPTPCPPSTSPLPALAPAS